MAYRFNAIKICKLYAFVCVCVCVRVCFCVTEIWWRPWSSSLLCVRKITVVDFKTKRNVLELDMLLLFVHTVQAHAHTYHWWYWLCMVHHMHEDVRRINQICAWTSSHDTEGRVDNPKRCTSRGTSAVHVCITTGNQALPKVTECFWY